MSTEQEYRIVSSGERRQTPCCRQSIRVKIVEPGVQSRRCALCHQVNWFQLTESDNLRWKGLLKLEWITAEEAAEILEDATDGDEFSTIDLSA